MSNMATEKDLDVGMRCIKYMLFVANFMFVLVGFLLITIGYTIKAIYQNFDQFMESHYYSPSNLAIAIGFIIFFIALFGCVGACKQSTCLVNTYTLLLTCVLILEISVSIAAYAMRANIESAIETNMKTGMARYDNYYYQFTWNATQYNLRCCGINGITDWQATYPGYQDLPSMTYQNATVYVPHTCCAGEDCTIEDNLYTNGCLNSLSYVISECALLLGVGALCVSFIQLLGIIFAHMLGKSIRKLKTQKLVEQQERKQHIYEQLANSGKDDKVLPVLYTPTSSEA